jgi:ribosomal-protein-alanine N-acetyltransferase
MTSILEINKVNFSTFIDRLFQIDNAEMHSPWDITSWSNLFNDFSHAKIYCLQLEGKLVAFSLYLVNDGPQYHLLKIAVSKLERGNGYGPLLLSDNIARFKAALVDNIYLEVSVNNHLALALYKKLGFTVLVEKKSFYSNGNNAYAMQLLLN